MQFTLVIISISLSALIGIGVGYYFRFLISLSKKSSIELQSKEMLIEIKDKASKITTEAHQKAQKIIENAHNEIKKENEKHKIIEDRLLKKEDVLEKKEEEISQREQKIASDLIKIDREKLKNEEVAQNLAKKLEGIANFKAEEAKQEIIKSVEERYANDFIVRMRKLELFGEEKLKDKARDILASTMQRLAVSVAGDTLSTVIDLPNEEIKGRIIGKDGRNIKSFERLTGVELIIDDTPNTITISSFDPVRRAVASNAIKELIKDGRIQPAKIEKIVESAQENIEKTIKEQGEKAAFECGVIGLDPRVLQILGRLHFRTSYGQNVLQHSIEMSHLAGMIAEEIGARVQVAKAAALVHDIGKALDHEVQGSHVEIGRKLLQKFNVQESIIQAMQSHHEEYPYENVESVIVQIADAISGARPGARRDNIENYLKRLAEIETIAKSFPNVEKAYALQAGREIRIFVKSEGTTDLDAINLAKNVADSIENNLKYPGEIKVIVTRETKAVQFAK